MLGSLLFVLGGDSFGLAVAVSFLFAEIVLTRYGHTRAGYSIGCLFFAFGDVIAIWSEVARDNSAFQITLAAMAAAWAVGAVRAPLAWQGHRSGNERMVRVADGIQVGVGAVTLALRFPGLIAAIVGASYLGAAAIACWAVADILVGRLQMAAFSSVYCRHALHMSKPNPRIPT